jgi:hypothetical protein
MMFSQWVVDRLWPYFGFYNGDELDDFDISLLVANVVCYQRFTLG